VTRVWVADDAIGHAIERIAGRQRARRDKRNLVRRQEIGGATEKLIVDTDTRRLQPRRCNNRRPSNYAVVVLRKVNGGFDCIATAGGATTEVGELRLRPVIRLHDRLGCNVQRSDRAVVVVHKQRRVVQRPGFVERSAAGRVRIADVPPIRCGNHIPVLGIVLLADLKRKFTK